MTLTPFQAETLALLDGLERDLRRFGSNYLYAGNPPCGQCDVALGSTDGCPACAAKRAEDRAKEKP